MSNAGKIIGALVLFGGGAYGISRLIKAGNTGKKISINVANVNPPKVQNGALILSVNAVVDNPTNHTLKIKKPYLIIQYNGSEIANSKTSDKYIDLKANDSTPIKDINIQVPLAKLGLAAINLISGKTANIAFDITVATEADGIPYNTHKHFEL